jgi:hypothetical protein
MASPERDLDAVERSLRETGQALRRLALYLGLVATRLGHEISDTRVDRVVG